jgi:integrase
MKTKPLPILEVREYYTNLFNELLESNQAYKYERLTECFLFILQSKTALRISDMLELKWSNIDTSSFETYLEIVLIKTKQPLTLPIDKSLFKLIQEYREYLRYEFNELNDYIFYNYKSSNGKNFSYVWSSKRIKLMPHNYLQILWYLWVNNIIQVDAVVRALALEDYNLGSLTKEGITAFKENEKFEFRYGTRE